MLNRRYTFNLYPNKAQAAALEMQCVLLARLWNAALEQREVQWLQQVVRFGRAERKGLGYYDQAREIKHIRAVDPDYKLVGSASMELTLAALDMAFKAFWRRLKEGKRGDEAGYPRYKRVSEHGTIWHRDGTGWKLLGSGGKWKLRAFGISGEIKARGEFPAVPAEYRTMEIIRRDGAWWASIVVRMEPRRAAVPEAPAATVSFDLIDEFARVEIRVDGRFTPGSSGANLEGRSPFARAREDEGVMPSRSASTTLSPFAHAPVDCDAIQSSRDRRFKKFSNRWKREKRRIARVKARDARRRREELHRWTTSLVASVSSLAVVAPPIQESTRSARGTKENPGAAVDPVAALNRHVLGQAPALAIQMLEYKAAEAAIPFARLTPDEHKIAVGRDLHAAAKAARKARRQLRKDAA